MNKNKEINTPIADQINASLKQWGQTIAHLEEEAQKAEAVAKSRMNDQVARLKTKKNELESKLTHLNKAGSQASDDVKEGVRELFDTLGKSIKDVREEFSKIV
ncbi:MAG: hypothetical protein R3A45_09930 [Bdellovibrionota bacterium]